MNPIVEELKERGLLTDSFGNIEEALKPGAYFYVGTDPTSDSLGVHHLVAFTTARLLQSYGLIPIVLVGTATCLIGGDPNWKATAREFIPDDVIAHNTECITKQIKRIIDFSDGKAILVNNRDWIGEISFIDFLRDVERHINVSHMLAKESTKSRLSRDGIGLSMAEFQYSILQAYDFLHLYKTYGCKIQLGGRDQTSSMDTGFELARKKEGIKDMTAFVWDLITDSTGKKFGKSEGNAVFLDPKKTTVYKFYQFWLNQSDEDSAKYIKLFTLIPLGEIKKLIAEHNEAPQKRLLQRTLAKYMTELIHGEDAYNKAVEASNILFGKGTTETLKSLDEETLLSVLNDVPKHKVEREVFEMNVSFIDVAVDCGVTESKTALRKLIKGGGISINKEKVSSVDVVLSKDDLLNDKYVLIQQGKKNYQLLIANG